MKITFKWKTFEFNSFLAIFLIHLQQIIIIKLLVNFLIVFVFYKIITFVTNCRNKQKKIVQNYKTSWKYILIYCEITNQV